MNEQQTIDPRRMAMAAQQASDLMKTLGHKDRLMVLCHLTNGEKSVGELARLLDIPQSPLSQHLARMRKEKLVQTRRDAERLGDRGARVTAHEMVVGALRRVREAGQAAGAALGVEAVAPTGEDLVRVGLVTDVPDEPVFGHIERERPAVPGRAEIVF